jgi:hypothetical protein
VTVTGDAPRPVRVGDLDILLEPTVTTVEAIARGLSIGAPEFPTDALGTLDIGHARSTVVVPAEWWLGSLRRLGLGSRARDQWSPWAFVAVPVRNSGTEPIDLVLTADVRRDGAPEPAFRPRLRAGDGDTGVVSALLRVPAGAEVVAALPVFVDEALTRDGAHAVSIEARPLGVDAVVARSEGPLYVRHGDTLATAGFATSCLAALGGLAWTARRLRAWLDGAATSELMTIALFGAALFVVGTASDVLSLGVAVALGPFGSLLTGLVQDVGRTALLATLLVLLPRPGILALALWTGWVGRCLTTGGFSVVDVIYTGATVVWMEGGAWLAGLTRGGGWREESTARQRWRMVLAFGGSGALTTLSGLWLHVILYRLYFADWYLAMQALIPGALYAGVACWLAQPFAASLRRVES